MSRKNENTEMEKLSNNNLVSSRCRPWNLYDLQIMHLKQTYVTM